MTPELDYLEALLEEKSSLKKKINLLKRPIVLCGHFGNNEHIKAFEFIVASRKKCIEKHITALNDVNLLIDAELTEIHIPELL